jgi:hypothetical protein
VRDFHAKHDLPSNVWVKEDKMAAITKLMMQT